MLSLDTLVGEEAKRPHLGVPIDSPTQFSANGQHLPNVCVKEPADDSSP